MANTKTESETVTAEESSWRKQSCRRAKKGASTEGGASMEGGTVTRRTTAVGDIGPQGPSVVRKVQRPGQCTIANVFDLNSVCENRAHMHICTLN